MLNREYKYTTEQLREFQALPLERKIGITCARLTEFYTHFNGKVFVSFSGGKDSTVLLYIARKLFPEIKALYLDTGLEYPEIKEFVKTFDNVDIRRPEISFKKVIETVGYPVVSKEMSQYISEYRNYLAKQKNAGIERKSPITEFEAISRENALHEQIRQSTRTGETYFKYLEDAIAANEAQQIQPKQNCKCYHVNFFLTPPPSVENGGKKYNEFRYNMCKRWAFLVDAPFKISSKCCNIMKKNVSHKYQAETGLHPIIGTMAEESLLRKVSWLKNGCNAFNAAEPKSTPMAFWTEQDVLKYIKLQNIPIASIYGDIIECADGKLKTTGAKRTGCMFCLFGIHHEKEPNRIQRLYFTHRKIYDYILDKLGFREVMEWLGVPYKPVIDLFNYNGENKNNA